jgi:hypothetical protein
MEDTCQVVERQCYERHEEGRCAVGQVQERDVGIESSG